MSSFICPDNLDEKVTFAKTVTYISISDEYQQDYYEARCGWVYKLDKQRFDTLVKSTEEAIGWIFKQTHRINIYSSRFNNNISWR
jgi:hypothetical protein